MSCSICFEAFNTPVVTPCGHIFCLDCLISCSQASPDATQAPCPTCRSMFSLVTANPLFIPEKYRQFIDSNIRRIYIDDSKTKRLQDRVTHLETRLRSLETDKELLMKRCESNMQKADVYATKERRANLISQNYAKELKQANETIARLTQLAKANDTSRVKHRSSLVDMGVERTPSIKDNRSHCFESPILPETLSDSTHSVKRRRVTRNQYTTPPSPFNINLRKPKV